MITQEENDRLTKVGPGTPMGNLMRRYWHPVGCSSLVTSKPKRVKVLGEELVLYRGASGKPVLMELRCAHRNVALDYGRVEGDSIRCPYHGWLYDQAGQCTAMPAEPEGDKSHEKVKLNSYPTEEISGLIFAYMGPAPAPVLPLYDVLRMTGGSKLIRSYPIHGNWLQGAENILDVAHFSWLHGYTFPAYSQKRPIYKFTPAEYGMDIQVGVEGQPPEEAPYVVPAINRFALPSGDPEHPLSHVLFYRVPIDDVSHENYMLFYTPSSQPPANDENTAHAVRFETKVGEYLAHPNDWWGIDLGDQDRMVMEQQGPVSDRTREFLVGTDVGIVRMRRLLRDAMEAVERGEDPIGVIRDPAKQNVEFRLSMGVIAQQQQEDTDYMVGLSSETASEKV